MGIVQSSQPEDDRRRCNAQVGKHHASPICITMTVESTSARAIAMNTIASLAENPC